MKARYIMIPAALVACAACAKIVEQPEQEGIPMTYRAYQEGAADTKTTVQNGGTQVYWEAADEIRVFFKNFSGRFVSQNSEPAEVADFSGNLSILVGANEGAGSSNLTWGLYPYREDASYDGEYVTTTLPASQTGRAGSFAKNTHISLAQSAGNELTFCNVTGGLRFSLTQEGITSVTFRGNDGEAIAGTIKISFEDGAPAISEVSGLQTTVTLTVPDGGTFHTGQWYYIETVPVALTKGFTMVFTKGRETATLNSIGSVSVLRGIYGSLANADEGLEFKYNGGTIGEAVDLGLSVKWASWNVGASKPEEYGDYFAWGETEPKDDYDWSTYKWCSGSSNTLTKYCPSDKTDYWAGSGSPDGKTVLDSEDDAASVNWGENWRMPTDAEWTELRNNCTWTWTSDYNGTGIKGRIVTSKKAGYEDRSIFLPAAGYRSGTDLRDVGPYGYYWSYSSLDTDYPYRAWRVYFHSGNNYRGYVSRYYGQSVRPVYGERIHPESVKLSYKSLSICVGSSARLTATVLPENVPDKGVLWSSDNSAVATVDHKGSVTALKEGTATITVSTFDGGKTAECVVTVVPMQVAEAIDLGLSVKWASFNLGSTRPEVFGYYYAWGETEPKSDYSWSTYKWCNGAYNKLTKYCWDCDFWAGSGSPDGKSVLDIEDDAASVNWGGSWRMPTYAESKELINNCTWTWTDDYNGTGVSGLILTSKKDGYTNKSIFLPAAGYREGTDLSLVGSIGNYWPSSRCTVAPESAYYFQIDGHPTYDYYNIRSRGFSVRPVTK